MQREIRRYRSSLIINGRGIIAFGVWSIIKAALMVFTDLSPIKESASIPEEYALLFDIIGVVLFVVFSGIVIGFHMYVGLATYHEGSIGKKGSFYLIVICFFTIVTIFELDMYLVPDSVSEENLITWITSFVIDITKAVILIDTLYVAIRLRLLLKNQEQ